MTRAAKRYLVAGLLGILLALGMVAAQEHGAAASSSSSSSTQTQPEQAPKVEQPNAPENPNREFGQEVVKTSEEAAAEAGKKDAKLAMELKAEHSPVVSWIGRVINIGPERAYWLSIIVNFGILVWLFWFLMKAKVPQMFRDRTATIQKGIKEAQAAAAEAAQRLKDIEARLAKLDVEVAEIRTSAESDAAAEEERIRQAAEEDKNKVVQAAEAEIAAIARNARRELKGYAANLAVDLAAKKIRVDEPTDHALVREFVDQFGKGGK